MDLAGTTALVTGGGRGIGRAVALTLASAGAAVAVLARSAEQVEDTAREVAARGAAGLPLVADVTDRHAVEQAVARAEAALGPVDLLVANAGRLAAAGPLWEDDPDEWWRDVEVGLRGTLLPARAVLPGMVARRRGRVVTLGSGAGVRPSPWVSAYSVAKAGLARLTDSLEASLAGTGVHAFLVAPGMVRTAMTRFPAAYVEREPAVADIPETRWRPAERTGQLVAALATGRYDALAGRFLHVDDDLDARLRELPRVAPEARTLRLAPWGDHDPLT